MADLNELMNLQGAVAAFHFSDKGMLLDSTIAENIGINSETLDLLCHMCVANTAIATMQARGWESVTGAQGFYPITGFSLIGLDWSAVASGNYGVVLANDDADYQAAFEALPQ